MFQKFTKQGFKNTMNKTKVHLGKAYHHTKTFLGNVDHNVQQAKAAYAILHPTVSHYAGNEVHNNITRGFNGYEDIRRKIVTGHNILEGGVTMIRKSGLNLGV
jgi:hypothetical protein